MILEVFKRFSLPEKHKFYVYFLIDPRNNNVFYIGKGKGKRINDHEYQASRGVCSKKCNKIRSIMQSGNTIIKHKIAGFENEQDAYDYESICINQYGLENLTNIIAGGGKAFERRYKESVKRYKAKQRPELPLWRSLSANVSLFVHWAKLTDFGKFRIESNGFNDSNGNQLKMPKFAKFIERAYVLVYNDVMPKLFYELISDKNQSELFFNEMKNKGVNIQYGSA
jgi:hypothetical protein